MTRHQVGTTFLPLHVGVSDSDIQRRRINLSSSELDIRASHALIRTVFLDFVIFLKFLQNKELGINQRAE